MAKRKKTQTATLEIPAGYRTIETGGNFGAHWDYETDPDLQGTVERLAEVEQGKGKNVRMVRVMEVRDQRDGVLYTVWESKTLEGLFDEVNMGDDVYIAFQGFQDIPGRKQPMKLFISGIHESKKRSRR